MDAGSRIPTFPFPFRSQVSIPKPAFVNFGWQDQLFLLLYIHFPFKKFLVNSSKNELWMGRCGRRGSVHHKYTLHSKHPLKQSVSFSSRGYSIYSFAQPAVLAQHWGKNFGCWLLDSYFFCLLFLSTVFFSKTCKCELRMSRSALPTFPHLFSL